MAEMRRGVRILAAAPGRVRAVRDGEPDTGLEGFETGKDCGNGIVVDHADGWSTQYCHLARGSIAVRPGQTVARGAPIGRMGLSGRTEFPHLHFTLRRDGDVVDPFDGGEVSAACGGAGEDLWAEPVAVRFGGLVDHGFIGKRPTLDVVREGLPTIAFDPADDVLIFWARAFGLRSGDVIRLRLMAPDGRVMASNDRAMDRARAEEFAFIGARRPSGGWAPGRYEAEVVFIRDERPAETRAETLLID